MAARMSGLAGRSPRAARSTTRRHRIPARAGLLAAAVLLLVSAAPVAGTRGVSVDLGRIDITEALVPGGTYTLPTLGVRNPGTERTSYMLVANPVLDTERVAPPATWFRFEPDSLTLDPGASAQVRIRIVLPTDASPGDYIALVGAQIATVGGGAQVGAAAAARTTFTIRPADGIQAALAWLRATFTDLLPWSAIVPVVLAGALALWVVRRRFSIGLRIERR